MRQRRPRQNPPPLGIKTRKGKYDADIFKFLYRHKTARSCHITEYLGGSAGAHLNRLNTLRTEEPKYLFCPPYQWRFGELSRHFIYANNDPALDVLEEIGYLNSQNEWVRQTQKKNRQFEHDLMVSDFSCLLDIALKDTNLVLHSWKEILERAERKDENPLRLPVNISFKGHTGGKTSVTPDYFFTIEYPDKFQCFAVEANLHVEIDRPDLDRPSVLKKLLAYDHLIETDALKKHFGMSQDLFLISTYNNKRKYERSMELVQHLKNPRRFLFLYDPALGHVTKSPTRIPFVFKRVGYPDFDLLKGGGKVGSQARTHKRTD